MVDHSGVKRRLLCVGALLYMLAYFVGFSAAKRPPF